MYCDISVAFSQVGPNNVHIALSLVEYKPELQKAMEFVFGTTFVCNNMDNAKKVAFDKRIMTRTVTLGGDVFDPHGTLSGGMLFMRFVFLQRIKIANINWIHVMTGALQFGLFFF